MYIIFILMPLQSVHCSINGNRGQVEGMVNLEAKFIVLCEESELRSEVVLVRILRTTVLVDLLRTDLKLISLRLIGFVCCYNKGIICVSIGYVIFCNI
jgi:hypothetical protein